MQYQQGDSRPFKREGRSEDITTSKRLHIPNLAVWSDIDSIETRKLQLWGQAIIRAVEEHRHRKMRRNEGMGT